MNPAPIVLARARFDWSRTYVMGVLNVTPDSFSDGGVHVDPAVAIAAGVAMAEQGADVVDVGGESTRPQAAAPVDAETECARVVPVIRGLVARGVTTSIDTTKAAVAEAALEAGAELVNDISGGLFDPAILGVIARAGAVFVCGHVRGRTLREVHAAEQAPPSFEEVLAELGQRLDALPAGLRERTIVDPGLGFGKRLPENLALTRGAGELRRRLGRPVMLGPSRKRYLGELTGAAVGDRDVPTVAAAL
ncbi:MAG TPA: dihydropteroate synthase, partial [Kofleriaceae bacterium]|nr:dihydropteroate synthase [Kofleriaceae bacterium]